MYIGIKYEVKRKVVNKQLQHWGNAIMFHGQTSHYFTNPIVAFRVKQYLNKKNTNFNYELQQLSKAEIRNKTLIRSYDEFLELAQARKTKTATDNQPTPSSKEEMGE